MLGEIKSMMSYIMHPLSEEARDRRKRIVSNSALFMWLEGTFAITAAQGFLIIINA
jgi:hypothetical protein